MESITLLITGLLVLVGFAPFFGKIFKFLRFKQIVDKIPGPKTYPLIGNIHLIAGKPRDEVFKAFCNFRTQFPGGIYRLWFGLMPDVKVSFNFLHHNLFKNH